MANFPADYAQLAECGRETWNRWIFEIVSDEDREKVPRYEPLDPRERADLAATLGVVSLPDPKQVHFSQYGFHKDVDFSGFIFPRRTPTSGDDQAVIFGAARFEGRVNFDDAIFLGGVNFRKAGFQKSATFNRSCFYRRTTFEDAEFYGVAFFEKAVFADRTYFDWCKFGRMASFRGACFRDGGISFNKAVFERSARFFEAVFHIAPEFHEAKLPQDTTFTDAEFEHCVSYDMKDKDSWDLAVRAFQTLKLKMNQFHSHEEEMRFFAYEMRTRAKHVGPGRKILYGLYGTVSDYGRSIARPLASLIGVVVAGALFNLQFIKLDLCWRLSCVFTTDGFSYFAKTLLFTLSSSLPFVGQGRLIADWAGDIFLKTAIPWVFAVSVFQGLLSTGLLFLLLLALRNLFRIK